MGTKKTFFLLTTLTSFCLQAQTNLTEQPKAWKSSFQTGVNLNQSAFSNSWKAGGGGTTNIAGKLFFSGKATYTKNKFTWDNTAQFEYGRQITKKKDYTIDPNGKDTTLNIKIADKLFLESKAGHKISDKISAYGSLAFLSQFDKGLDERSNKISYFMSPGYLTESFGLDYKPNADLSMQLGLITLRQTFLGDKQLYHVLPSNYGVDTGKTFRNEMGTQVVVDYKKEIFLSSEDRAKKNPIVFKLRYWGFLNYQATGKNISGTTEKAGIKAIDHRFDISLSTKLNKYMDVSFGYVILYDIDQDVRAQHAQNFALGILYNFSR